jgi:hypothetical protein
MISDFRSLERKKECGTLTGLRFGPNASARAFDNLLAKSEPDPRAFKSGPVQPLEYAKDLRKVFAIDTNAVVADGEQPRSAYFRLRIDSDHRPFATRICFFAVLQGIPNQVLKELYEMDLRHLNGRETPYFNQSASVVDHG